MYNKISLEIEADAELFFDIYSYIGLLLNSNLTVIVITPTESLVLQKHKFLDFFYCYTYYFKHE